MGGSGMQIIFTPIDYVASITRFGLTHRERTYHLIIYSFHMYGPFEENNRHWAFYAFREDTWNGMDYELVSEAPPWAYWKAKKDGTEYALNRDVTHHQFSVLLRALNNALTGDETPKGLST
jgi:hypothetical protein